MLTVKRVGIIGFGMIGKVHAYAHQTLPYYLDPLPFATRITHIVTAHQETATKAQALTGAEHVSTDFRDVTENPDIDIVHICTPNEMHLPLLLSAMQHDKHIYCDKPLVTGLDEAEQVREAFGRYKGVSQMTFHLRYFPAIQRAKQLIDAGRLGRILQFRIGYYNSSNVSAASPYRWKHLPTGGVIRDLGSHVLDLADHLLGPFDELLAESHIAHPLRHDLATGVMREVTVEDTATFLVRLKNGALGTLETSKLATGAEDELRLEIHGEQGALRFQLTAPHDLEFFDATTNDRPFGGDAGWLRIACGSRFQSPDTDFPSPKARIGWTRAHTACLAHFIQIIAAAENPTSITTTTSPFNDTCYADLMQGCKIEELMLIAMTSAKARQWAKVIFS